MASVGGETRPRASADGAVVLDQRALETPGADQAVGHRCRAEEQTPVAPQVALELIQLREQFVERHRPLAADAARHDRAAPKALPVSVARRRVTVLEDLKAGLADVQCGRLGLLGDHVKVTRDPLELRVQRTPALRPRRRRDSRARSTA